MISYRVVQEVLNLLTTRMARPVHHEDALRYFATTLEPMSEMTRRMSLIDSRCVKRIRMSVFCRPGDEWIVPPQQFLFLAPRKHGT